jgi:hypothetical protein
MGKEAEEGRGDRVSLPLRRAFGYQGDMTGPADPCKPLAQDIRAHLRLARQFHVEGCRQLAAAHLSQAAQGRAQLAARNRAELLNEFQALRDILSGLGSYEAAQGDPEAFAAYGEARRRYQALKGHLGGRLYAHPAPPAQNAPGWLRNGLPSNGVLDSPSSEKRADRQKTGPSVDFYPIPY